MTYINKRFSALVLAGALSFFASCGDDAGNVKTDADSTKMGTQSSSDVAEDSNKTKMEGEQRDDANFLTDAAAANMAEIAALKSGMSRSGNAELKKHAEMMLKDHEKMAQDVMAYAKKKGISLPAEANNSDKQKLADLEKKTGVDYDKAWAQMMVDDHQKVVDMFESKQGKAADPELNSMIATALPIFRSHLDMSKQFNDKIK